jgi:hypothetical protein
MKLSYQILNILKITSAFIYTKQVVYMHNKMRGEKIKKYHITHSLKHANAYMWIH